MLLHSEYLHNIKTLMVTVIMFVVNNLFSKYVFSEDTNILFKWITFFLLAMGVQTMVSEEFNLSRY
jgi:small neutral amino acid transporter SnatA (MarC family)